MSRIVPRQEGDHPTSRYPVPCSFAIRLPTARGTSSFWRRLRITMRRYSIRGIVPAPDALQDQLVRDDPAGMSGK